MKFIGHVKVRFFDRGMKLKISINARAAYYQLYKQSI